MGEKNYFVAKANYTAKEQAGMSEYRKKVAEMDGDEWCKEWDRVTAPFKFLSMMKKKREKELNEH